MVDPNPTVEFIVLHDPEHPERTDPLLQLRLTRDTLRSRLAAVRASADTARTAAEAADVEAADAVADAAARDGGYSAQREAWAQARQRAESARVEQTYAEAVASDVARQLEAADAAVDAEEKARDLVEVERLAADYVGRMRELEAEYVDAVKAGWQALPPELRERTNASLTAPTIGGRELAAFRARHDDLLAERSRLAARLSRHDPAWAQTLPGPQLPEPAAVLRTLLFDGLADTPLTATAAPAAATRS